MKKILTGGKSQIITNGKHSKVIISKRRLRQGHRISSLLFVLAVDTKMLQLAVDKKLLLGLGPFGLRQKVFCLL